MTNLDSEFLKKLALHFSPRIFLACAVFFLLLMLCPFQKAFARGEREDGAVIESVEVRGNKRIETAAILQKVHSQKGSTYSKELVRDDIRSIFGLGFFDNVEAYDDEGSEGIKIVFEVKERPIVSKIEYEGLDALEKDDLKDQIQQKEFEVLDLQKIQNSIEKLSQKYEEKGYYLADVRYQVVLEDKRNEAKLVFKIEENDKIQVKKINIIGNSVLSADDLKKVMQTKEGGAFSWMTGSGAYREAVFERDVAAMTFYYGTLGYVRARFGKPEVTVSPDKKWIYITFSVDEGVQYNVGKVDFNGDLLYSRQELKDDLQLVEGETFNTETLRRETLKYTDKYGDLGYAFANVVPQPIIHDDTRTVDVTFDIDRGEKVYIGKIVVTSNTRTKDKVIRRELKINEGELFNGSRKRESRENVMRLGFFDSVEFHQSTPKDQSNAVANVVDIEVKVKERSTGQLMISAGYSTGDAGFIASAQLSQNNFLGNGQVASLMAQMVTGRKQYEYSLNFQEPYVGYSLWSLGGSFSQLRREVGQIPGIPTFVEVKTGADVKLGHPVYHFTNLYLSYRLEHSWVDPSTIIDQKIISKDSVNGFTSSATANLIYDKRDDRFDPRDGLYGSISAEYAGLGGNRKFLKNSGNFKFFHPLIWDFVFRMNVTAANVRSVGGQDVAINERYILGGLYSLRGYPWYSVGPKRTIAEGGDTSLLSQTALNAKPSIVGQQIVIGGLNQAFMNAEIEFPLLKEARIRGVIFFDAGNAWDQWHTIQGPKVLADIGWGFRWFTPIGPLRFEFGYPIVGGGSTQFQFTIGPPF